MQLIVGHNLVPMLRMSADIGYLHRATGLHGVDNKFPLPLQEMWSRLHEMMHFSRKETFKLTFVVIISIYLEIL
jgi:hypothetical protein